MMKRLMDIMGSLAGLALLSPLLLALSALVLICDGRPIFFRQSRPGRGGRPFRIVKFRTMKEGVGPDGKPLDDAAKLTRLGKILRSTSLDELPELWNVLVGEMSLVGPRPLLMDYLPLYSTRQARRHEVRPGVTGWAQVNGRNAIGWDSKLDLDIWYVDNRSLGLDMRILLMTIVKVFQREAISAQGHATMPRFEGNASPPPPSTPPANKHVE